MKRSLIIGGIVTGVVLVAASIALIVSQNKNDEASMQNAVATDQVAIQDYMFAPIAITVKTGTKVTWTNNDTVKHTISSYDGRMPDSGELGHGQTYSYTFTKAGTYKYHCSPHPNMKASIIVTD